MPDAQTPEKRLIVYAIPRLRPTEELRRPLPGVENRVVVRGTERKLSKRVKDHLMTSDMPALFLKLGPSSPPPCKHRILRQGGLLQPVVIVDDVTKCMQRTITSHINC